MIRRRTRRTRRTRRPRRRTKRRSRPIITTRTIWPRAIRRIIEQEVQEEQ